MRMRLYFSIISGMLYLCMPAPVVAEQAASGALQVAAPVSSSQQAWLKLGWEQISANNNDAALATWQQGVNRMPPKRLLAFIGLYSGLPNAVEQLKRIGLAEKVLILHSDFKGKKAYYLLSAQDVPADHELRRKKLASLYKVMQEPETIFANAAKKFQTATVSASATTAAVTTAGTPSQVSAPAQGKQPSKQAETSARSPKESANKERNIAKPDASNIESSKSSPVRQYVVENSVLDHTSGNWLVEGWQQIEQGDADAALAIWQQGVNALPNSQLLAFLGVYSKIPAAMEQLKRIGLAEKAIILRSNLKGKQAYFVMSARDIPSDKSIRREKLASLFQASQITGMIYANVAAKFQTEAHIIVPTSKTGTFTINRFNIIGNTLIADEILQKMLKFYTGNNKTRGDLIAAKKAILRLYHEKGYEMIAVGLPRNIKGGTIPLRIFEARIGKVLISGSSKATSRDIKSTMSALKPGETANADMIDEQFRAISQRGNIKSAQLIYHPTDEGTVDVEIVVNEENPIKIGLMASSLGTQEVGRSLFTGIFYHSNLWNAGHQLTVTYTGSEKFKNLRIYSAMYQIPFENIDGNLILSYSRSDVRSGQVLGVLNARGDGTLKSVHYKQKIFSTNTSRHYLDFGYEQHLFNDRFRHTVLPLALDVGILAHVAMLGYSYERNSNDSDFDFKMSYYRNTPFGARKRNAAYQLINPAARANWDLYRFSAKYNYDFNNNWSLSGMASGQFSKNTLISGERFYITGLSKVRGFEEAEASGDSAFFVRAQLTSPVWYPDTRFHFFVDSGRYELNAPLPTERSSDNIVSTGLGAKWTPSFGLDVLLEGGVVVDGLSVAPIGSAAGHFKVIYWFQ